MGVTVTGPLGRRTREAVHVGRVLAGSWLGLAVGVEVGAVVVLARLPGRLQVLPSQALPLRLTSGGRLVWPLGFGCAGIGSSSNGVRMSP